MIFGSWGSANRVWCSRQREIM